MKRCLHQIKKPKRRNLKPIEGVGECVECEYDEEENKKCKMYIPVNITIVDDKVHKK